MPIQLVLDHSDFTKSRRALIASSVVLFIFSELTMVTNEVEIFKLKLLLNQSKLVIFSMCLTSYFVYIFLIRAYEYVKFATAQDPEKQLALLGRNLDETIRSFIVSQVLETMDENSMRNSIQRRGQQNTYELADGAASLAQEAKQIVEDSQLQTKEHPHPEVGLVVEAIEAIISDFRLALSRQLRRSNSVMCMVEILPPFIVAGVAMTAGYFFVI